MKPRITNIQRFCVHDGPGIRTTVFFKGCTLRCPWCANPENIKAEQEYFHIGEKREPIGREYADVELAERLLRDEDFYGEDGGVTFSGGEPLLALGSYAGTLEMLRDKGISLCVETALYVPEEAVRFALAHIDFFIVDVKLLEKEICKNVIDGDVELYEKNLRLVSEAVGDERLTLRIPMVRGVTDTAENKERMLDLLAQIKPGKVEVFSVHALAKKKYERLGLPMRVFEPLSEAELQRFAEELSEKNIVSEVIRI